MYNEVKVVPQVVLPGDMKLKCDLLVLKLRPLQTWRGSRREKGREEGGGRVVGRVGEGGE